MHTRRYAYQTVCIPGGNQAAIDRLPDSPSAELRRSSTVSIESIGIRTGSTVRPCVRPGVRLCWGLGTVRPCWGLGTGNSSAAKNTAALLKPICMYIHVCVCVCVCVCIRYIYTSDIYIYMYTWTCEVPVYCCAGQYRADWATAVVPSTAAGYC
jgi:hypothetical protein